MKPRKWKRQRLSDERRAQVLLDLERRKWSHDGAVTHPLFIGLVGGIFSAVGLTLFIGLVCGSLYGYWRTKGEVTVPAQLQSVEWVRRSKTSYTSVRYDYQVGSEKFTGTNLALFGEEGGAYHSLLSSFETGTSIRVFIDPAHPGFSVIDRHFKWWPFIGGTIFSVAFTGVGFFILRHLFRTRRMLGLPLI